MARDPEADGPSTSGMIALVPTVDDAERLAIPDGEDADELHVTLFYLGDDVTGWPDGAGENLAKLLHAAAPGLEPVHARVFAHANFNPDGGPDGDRTPCAVYLVGDGEGITQIRNWLGTVLRDGDDYVNPPPQHSPFVPHITAGYNKDAAALRYTGNVTFDRLRLALPWGVVDIPLGGDEADLDEEFKAILAEIETKDVHSGSAPATTVPAGLGGIPKRQKCKYCKAPATKRMLWADGRAYIPVCDAHQDKARHQIVTVNKDEVAKVQDIGEGKSGEPVGTERKVMSPDPRAAKLRDYWAFGAGRRKWRPGGPGDFKRLRRHLGKYVQNPRMLDGLTANIHKLATGEWPGRNAHTGKGNVGKALKVGTKAFPMPDVDYFEQDLHDGVHEWGGHFVEENVDGYNFDDEPTLGVMNFDPDDDEDGAGDEFSDFENDGQGDDGEPGDESDEDGEDPEEGEHDTREDIEAAVEGGVEAVLDESDEDDEPDEDEEDDEDEEERRRRFDLIDGKSALLDPADLALLRNLQFKAVPDSAVDDLTLNLERHALAEDTLVTPDDAGADEDSWPDVVQRDKRYQLSGGAVLKEDVRAEREQRGKAGIVNAEPEKGEETNLFDML